MTQIKIHFAKVSFINSSNNNKISVFLTVQIAPRKHCNPHLIKSKNKKNAKVIALIVKVIL